LLHVTKIKQYKTKQMKRKHEIRKIFKYKKICLILHTTTNWCLVYVQDFKATKFLKNNSETKRT